MVTIVPDINLSFKEYQASLQQNPTNIFYQRIASRNVSTQQCSFTVSSPNKRTYLLSNAQIEWRFEFLRVITNNVIPDPATVNPNVNSRDLISLKSVLPVTNAMSSITTSINGSTTTIAQPRRFMECLSMAHVSREEALLHYEAGYPDRMGGSMLTTAPTHTWAYNEVDVTMQNQYYDFNSRRLRGNKLATPFRIFNANAAANGGTILVTEPLVSAPFDCYSKVDKASMPDWSPWKWMSPVIPLIDRLEIDIQFTNLVASMMFFFYGKPSVGNNRPAMVIVDSATNPAANLLLYWAEVPVSTNIPRSIDLKSKKLFQLF